MNSKNETILVHERGINHLIFPLIVSPSVSSLFFCYFKSGVLGEIFGDRKQGVTSLAVILDASATHGKT